MHSAAFTGGLRAFLIETVSTLPSSIIVAIRFTVTTLVLTCNFDCVDQKRIPYLGVSGKVSPKGNMFISILV